MSQPFIVEIPHRLGKDEALRRLETGIARIGAQYSQMITFHEQIWSGDRLSFRAEALKQMVSGTLDVRDESVRVEMQLPWLLAKLAHGIEAGLRKSGALLLEKKP